MPLLILWARLRGAEATGTSLAAIVLDQGCRAIAQGGIYGNVDAGTGPGRDPGDRRGVVGPPSSSGSPSAPISLIFAALLVDIAMEILQ